jgi:hypothetical protein
MATTNEELQKQVERLKKEKEKVEAEKAKLDAEKALADAKKALEQPNTSASELSKLLNEKALADAKKALADANKALESSTSELSRLQDQKALADAQKALADSQKALDQTKSPSGQQLTDLQNEKALADAQKVLAEAQTQAAIAKYIGDVKAGPYTGSVEMREKAGTEEALLLAARAVKKSAAKVAEAVKTTDVAKLYIFSAKEFPSFQRLLTFRFRKETIKQAFAAAGIAEPVEAVEGIAAPALVAAGLDAFSKLLGFFKSDYTVGGIDVKLDESLLLFSVAGALREKEVHLPTIFEPTALDSTISDLVVELADLQKLQMLTANAVNQTKEAIAKLEREAADPQNAATREALLKEAAALKPRVEQLNGVIALYDSFVSSLTTADANGILPLVAVAQEFAIDTALKAGAAVLLLRLENSGGGFLLKKNLWTGLGSMPLFHMGGATVTYLLLSGDKGKVLAGDVIPFYGGFIRTDKLSEELNKP